MLKTEQKMKRTTKPHEQGKAVVAVSPRLVKAGEIAARAAENAAKSERKAETKGIQINPALKRTPRNAVEARDMFKALFNEAA
jgi:hypothetical protein